MADPLDEHLWKQDVVASFAGIEGGIVEQRMDMWWEMFRNSDSLPLRAARVTRYAARFLIRRLAAKAVNFSSKSRRIDLNQQIDNLRLVLAQANEDIAELGGKVSVAHSYKAGRLTATAPVVPSDDPYTEGYPDATNPEYRGSAYWPRRIDP